MGDSLQRIICDPECGFIVQSHDENELVSVGMQHAKDAHKITVSADEARKMINAV